MEKYLGIFALWLLLVHFQFVLRSKSTQSVLILQFRKKNSKNQKQDIGECSSLLICSSLQLPGIHKK